MAPVSAFPCSVCDDEFSSVSTLHYHQMCLHTTEELSLAILSIRELTVTSSPATGDGVPGYAASPSTDVEEKLLRNGLAKYPKFLNSSGGRKSKVQACEAKSGDGGNGADTPKNLVKDKENIVQNNALGKDSDNGSEVKESGENKDEKLSESKDSGEPVRSSLWGAIKTLDGKAVDAPVIKIDKRRGNNRVIKSSIENSDKNDNDENGDQLSRKVPLSPACQDSDSPAGKEVLEKHLKLMNMSSFDDCIELECSDDSDEDAETLITDGSDDDAKVTEVKEEEIDPMEDVISDNAEDARNVGLKKVPDLFKNIRSKRIREKIQKHSTWYKGGNFQTSANFKAPKDSISISKSEEKSIKGKEYTFDGSEFEGKDSSPPNKDVKVFSDSCVQTDNFFFEEVSNGVMKMLEASNDRVINFKPRSTPRKGTPRRKSHSQKSSKVKAIKQEICDIKEEDMLDRVPRIKSEVVILDGEKRFYCNDCAKTYKKRSHLERHKRVHTGERPFGCPYCDKGFSVRSILNQHIRIHTGEKPYACTICAARFPQKSGLMTHMMLHTGKPFKCDQCDKAFVSNHKLVHHLKSHDGDRPHVCDLCSSAFFTAAALSDHKTLHSRNRKHVCNKCNASFVHEVYLKIHLATHLLEADCENETGEIDVGSRCGSVSPHSNSGQRNELTLTLDAIDQFCNGETIMMDLSV
ncbi:zinc finger protein 480-like [Ischnura elegans]|uniref:zinc finger protein 480-like n=1 Tax=Ischnura elegans TaxID=197161 RepID=UPI001ED8BDCB|nr:zinc finger protein 480-like [Ischnura elegans]